MCTTVRSAQPINKTMSNVCIYLLNAVHPLRV